MSSKILPLLETEQQQYYIRASSGLALPSNDRQSSQKKVKKSPQNPTEETNWGLWKKKNRNSYEKTNSYTMAATTVAVMHAFISVKKTINKSKIKIQTNPTDSKQVPYPPCINTTLNASEHPANNKKSVNWKRRKISSGEKLLRALNTPTSFLRHLALAAADTRSVAGEKRATERGYSSLPEEPRSLQGKESRSLAPRPKTRRTKMTPVPTLPKLQIRCHECFNCLRSSQPKYKTRSRRQKCFDYFTSFFGSPKRTPKKSFRHVDVTFNQAATPYPTHSSNKQLARPTDPACMHIHVGRK